MIEKVIKRDGTTQVFESVKIANAILKAMTQVSDIEEPSWRTATIIANKISKKDFPNNIASVEELQDLVEDALMRSSSKEAAKEYIRFRHQRNVQRKAAQYAKFDEISSASQSDMTRENANMNAETPAGQISKYASVTTKEYALDELLDPIFSQKHKSGDFHIHDLDYYPTKSFTCVQHPLDNVFKGFTAQHAQARSPKRIETAAILACISFQTAQNEFHGGQAIPAFDFYMAPYVKLTFKEEIDNACTLFDIKDRGEHSWMYNSPDEYEYKDLGETEGRERAYRHAINQTVRRVYQAMESFVHNLNTMHSRGGNQVVFSSINYGTDTSAEGRCIMRELLKVTLQGVGNNQTALFPIQIWKVKEGVNYNPEDKNYDLYKFACEVSSKRYFPNFLNLDATYNKDENWNATDPLRYMHEVATMGAARGDETVSIKINDSEYYNIPISSAYELLKKAIRSFNCEDRKSGKLSQFRHLDGVPCVYKITHIPTGQYYIGSTKNFYGRLLEHRYSCRHRGTIGDLFFINDYDTNNLEFTILEENVSPDILLDLEDKYIDLSDPLCVNQKSPLNNGNYDKDKFQGIMHRKLQGKDKRYGNYVQKYRTLVHKVPNNKEVYILSNNQWTPIRALMYNDNCMILNMFEVTFDKNGKTQTLHITEDHPLHTKRGRVRADELVSGDIIFDSITKEEYTITSVVPTDEDCPTYDFEVDNDCFDLSGIISHNCRTRVFENRFGPKTSVGRGNLSFTTINLPRLGILAMQEFPDDETKRVEYFFELLHDMCDKTAKQLEDRFQFQKTAFKRQFPFMMNYLWIDGNTLSEDDRVDSVINQGTLGIGFIGLAECLIALTGKHHGESMESQQLGLKIIGYMRSLANDYSEQYQHNYSVIGTPAEGLAGRFTKLDRKKFGIIPGITNKDFYTNSSHVPVYYHISPSQKAAIECPYHEMERGGHIFYVEMDSVVGNPEAIMRVVDIARSYNGGYISINYNSNTCLSCGHQWIGRDQVCPVCGSEGISTLQRITGYLVGETSKWNDGKLAELKARVEHKL